MEDILTLAIETTCDSCPASVGLSFAVISIQARQPWMLIQDQCVGSQCAAFAWHNTLAWCQLI